MLGLPIWKNKAGQMPNSLLHNVVVLNENSLCDRLLNSMRTLVFSLLLIFRFILHENQMSFLISFQVKNISSSFLSIQHNHF